MLLDQLVNGVTLGAQYALIAFGLALIFSVVGMANFAQGEVYMLAAYVLFMLEGLGLPYVVAGVLTIVVMCGFGVLFYGVVFRPVSERGWRSQIIATLAASLLITNLVIVIGGALPKLNTSPWSGVIVDLGGVTMSLQRILVVVATVVAFGALALWVSRSKAGKGMRALSQNREAAVIMGIPVGRLELTAVVIGCAMTALAAVLVTPLGNVTPTMGAMLTLKAFAAIIMGGFGNIAGPVVSAFILGIIEALAAGYISSAYADVFVFGAMILVLVLRPRGLFGRAMRA